MTGNLVTDSMLSTALYGTIIFFLEGMLKMCNLVIGLVSSSFNELINNPAVQGYLTFLQAFAAILFIVGIGFAISEWAIGVNEGNADNIMSTFKYIILGLFTTLGFTTIPILLMQFTAECTDLMINEMNDFSGMLENMINHLVYNEIDFGSNVLWIIFCIIFVVSIFKIFLSNMKRGGVLLIQLTACPLHIFNIPRGHVDAFFNWCKQILALLLTTFVQNFLLALSVLMLGTGSGLTVVNMCLCMGVLLAANEAPQILQQYGLDSSVRANPSQAIFAASGITNIIRSFSA